MSLRVFQTTEQAARFAGLFDGDGSAIAQIKPNSMYVKFSVPERNALLYEIQQEIGDGQVRDRRTESVSDYILTKRDLIADVLEDILPYLRKDVKQLYLLNY